jgi:hypothetical protein
MTRPVAARRREEEVGAGLEKLNLLRWTNEDVLRLLDTNDGGGVWNDDADGAVSDKTIRRAADENFMVNN